MFVNSKIIFRENYINDRDFNSDVFNEIKNQFKAFSNKPQTNQYFNITKHTQQNLLTNQLKNVYTTKHK